MRYNYCNILTIVLSHDCTVERAVSESLIPPRFMYAPDYQKELALRSEKRVPTIVAFLMIAALGVALWFSYQAVKAHFAAEEQANSAE